MQSNATNSALLPILLGSEIGQNTPSLLAGLPGFWKVDQNEEKKRNNLQGILFLIVDILKQKNLTLIPEILIVVYPDKLPPEFGF